MREEAAVEVAVMRRERGVEVVEPVEVVEVVIEDEEVEMGAEGAEGGRRWRMSMRREAESMRSGLAARTME